jgi:putative ABC transport system permease protein
VKYLGLLWSGLFRRKTRTLLTLLSIAVAFLLFTLLQSVGNSFVAGSQLAGVDRLVTSPRYSVVDPLPFSHLQRIRSVPGVTAATHADWFGGQYQDPSNFFPKYPVNPREWFEMYPELRIDPAQLQALERTRTGAVAPKAMAAQYGWKVGDRIPIEANIWPKRGGDRNWEFDLVGLYEAKPGDPVPDTFLFNYDYFDEAREFATGTVGWFVVRVADPQQAASVAQRIDASFANSAHETRTSTEQEFQASFLKQLGDIGLIITSILGAVFFTILLLTGNTMAQAFRERIPELAVLKTLGFRNGTVMALLLGEAVLLTVIAALLGVGLAYFLAPGLKGAPGGILANFAIAPITIVLAVIGAVILGLVTGIIPALQGARLTIVEALRRQ